MFIVYIAFIAFIAVRIPRLSCSREGDLPQLTVHPSGLLYIWQTWNSSPEYVTPPIMEEDQYEPWPVALFVMIFNLKHFMTQH